ncbi:hypothetical protein OS493_039447 [Desmophyllum pertusum]|uniref:Uncharacterized protein n=1 Tax=Desmophyllum pertusum TaxID=174260 RepID=A0A9X0CW83_9CNID|nr:hypothetical protein OS493_039447 [Desmophyllum pertusum]
MNKAMSIGVLFLFCVLFLMVEKKLWTMGCQPDSDKKNCNRGKRRTSICLAARALRCNEQEQTDSDDNNILMEVPRMLEIVAERNK